MTRPHRIYTDVYPYHVTTHLVDGLYFQDDELDMCVAMLVKTQEKYDIEVISYNFMRNHYHLIVKTSEKNINRAMQWMNCGIGKRFNKMRRRKGHLWRERYFAKIIETDEQLLACMRYVDRNSYTAGLVDDPVEWKWSSLREYSLNLAEDNRITTPPSIYLNISRDAEERYCYYKRMMWAQLPNDKKQNKIYRQHL